ncbi:MAG: hypothetical protein R3C56_10180 [Pirellulaceae bacterium]
MIFELVGGPGIFLLGMKNMSDGMQAVAGNSLRRLIGPSPTIASFATTAGVLVTRIVQSSSRRSTRNRLCQQRCNATDP